MLLLNCCCDNEEGTGAFVARVGALAELLLRQ